MVPVDETPACYGGLVRDPPPVPGHYRCEDVHAGRRVGSREPWGHLPSLWDVSEHLRTFAVPDL